MTNVVSTTNSLNCLKEDGTRYTLLGFSDVNNYYPYISLEQSNNKIDKSTLLVLLEVLILVC